MDIVALLSDALLARVRSVMGDAHTVHAVRTLGALDAALTLLPAAVVMIDPLVPALGDVAALLPVIEKHERAHMLVYTVADPAAMRAYGVLAAHGVRHLAVCGVDDGADDFRRLLEMVPADRLTGVLLQMVDPLLGELPPALARAIGLLFRAPQMVPDTDALARLAGMSRRACDRALERAEIAPGDILIRTARVVRAYHYLTSTRFTVHAIAAMTGYGRPRSLARDVFQLTGTLPSSLRHGLDAETFLMRVAARLRRSGPAPARTRDPQLREPPNAVTGR